MAKQKPPPQMNNMLRQVQQMQADMEAANAALAATEVEASAGGGMVTATVTGGGALRSIKIKPEVVDPDDVEMLEDLVVAAVTEALRLAEEQRNEALGGVTGGLDLSSFGLGGLLG